MRILSFASDYMEGAHPALMRRLAETNLMKSSGYGTDSFSESAREKIRNACDAPEAEVYFLAGGTQANAVVIGAMLRPYQGVLAAETGHVAVHEAGAIEAGGHKVIPLPQRDGKLSAESVRQFMQNYLGDANHDHMVMPGLVYLSQPTEMGTIYSLRELSEIHAACREYGIALYADGARLAYALASPENDVTLPDLAALCDCFYIGGTKCGALFGEAVVFPRPGTVPGFFTIVKQKGALLAKGRIAGVQFETLFTDGLYEQIGADAVRIAGRIRNALMEKGYKLAYPSPTNQVFPVLTEEQYRRLSEKVEMSFWERTPDGRTVVRLATSWATREEEADALIAIL